MKDFFHENRWQLITLVLITFAVFLNGLNSAFVSDDITVIVTNPYIGHIKGYVFTSIGFIRSLYMTTLYHLGGLHPWVYRLFNILFHSGVVILLYQFFAEISNKKIALLTTLIFAIHPLVVESVTWISGGTYPQYAVALIIAFLFFRRGLHQKPLFNLTLGTLFFFLSLGSGEKAIALPLLLILYLVFIKQVRTHWKATIPFFTLATLWGLLLISKIGDRLSKVAASPSPPGYSNFFLQLPIAIISYLKLTFWPAQLTLYQSELRFTWHQFYWYAFFLIIFLSIIIFSFYKNKQIFFGLCWFLIALSPTLTPLGVSWVVAERYAYLALPGLIFAVVILFDKLGEKMPKEIVWSFLILIILSLSLRTIRRNMDWKDEDTLWTATVAISKSSPNAHNNMGDVYTRHGNFAAAAQSFSRALELQPTYAEAYHNLGNALYQMGQKDKSVESYFKAIELKPTLWQAHQNVATVLFDLNKPEEAIYHLKIAQQINPNNSALHTNLGTIYFLSGRTDEARAEYQKALSINPEDVKAQAGLKRLQN